SAGQPLQIELGFVGIGQLLDVAAVQVHDVNIVVGRQRDFVPTPDADVNRNRGDNCFRWRLGHSDGRQTRRGGKRNRRSGRRRRRSDRGGKDRRFPNSKGGQNQRGDS